jgi:hypothetical protein
MTNKDMFKGPTYDSLEEQVGGKHYKKYGDSTRIFYK